MPNYDAGPGDWSDRDWESADRKPAAQAKRRLTLPPWLLVTGAVVIAILLCVALVLIIRALRAKPETTPTVEATSLAEGTSVPEIVVPTSTAISVIVPTEVISATATAVIPGSVTPSPVVFTEIAPGAQVVVQGTLGLGLNLRASPSTSARLVGSAKDGNVLTVLEGPQEADGYTWWKVKTGEGKEGWAAGKFLALKTP